MTTLQPKQRLGEIFKPPFRIIDGMPVRCVESGPRNSKALLNLWKECAGDKYEPYH